MPCHWISPETCLCYCLVGQSYESMTMQLIGLIWMISSERVGLLDLLETVEESFKIEYNC